MDGYNAKRVAGTTHTFEEVVTLLDGKRSL